MLFGCRVPSIKARDKKDGDWVDQKLPGGLPSTSLSGLGGYGSQKMVAVGWPGDLVLQSSAGSEWSKVYEDACKPVACRALITGPDGKIELLVHPLTGDIIYLMPSGVRYQR